MDIRYTESKDIANEFANKYSLLYNSVRSDPDELHSLAYKIDDGIQSSCMHDHCSFTHRITIDHIVESVQLLRPGKSGGANGVMSDRRAKLDQIQGGLQRVIQDSTKGGLQ